MIRLTTAICCKPEWLKFMCYWLLFSSFTDTACCPCKVQLWALLFKQGMWLTASGGGVSFRQPPLSLPGWAWLQVERPHSPWALQPHLHTACHCLLVLAPTWTGVLVWSNLLLNAWGNRLPRSRLTYDLLARIYDLSFLQDGPTMLSGLTQGSWVRPTWVQIPILISTSITT